jgi:transcriptional regulator with XRE-family HTH domain
VTTLAALRRQRAWSQRELAKQAGVSPSVIVQLEAGRTRYPKYKVIRALAAALGVEPRDVDEFRQMVSGAPEPRRLVA